MNSLAFACFLLSISCAQSAKPIVKQVTCKKPNWPDNTNPTKWDSRKGLKLQHKGFTEADKPKSVKIADFFLQGNGPTIFCEAKTGGGTIDSYWISRVYEDTNRIWVFGEPGKDTLHFGVKGNGATPTTVRVELYGDKAPKSPTVTCATGLTDKDCAFLIEIRDYEDQS